MTAEKLDRLISPQQNACTALLALFDDQPGPIRDAAHIVVPAMTVAAERLARRHLRQQGKHFTLNPPRAVRLAPTADDGIELVMHFGVSSVSRTLAATPAGTLVAIYQTRGKWDAPAAAVGVIARSLARRRPRVPVRPFEAMLLSDKAAAA